MEASKHCGVLCHITSLPSPGGIGTLGKQAKEFVDFLVQAGQDLWQVLPLTPTGMGFSPYQPPSVLAGNPDLIDLWTLQEEGLLTPEELEGLPQTSSDQVDYPAVRMSRQGLLRQACQRMQRSADYEQFLCQQHHWLEDYALYMGLHDRLQCPWNQWPAQLRDRQAEALTQAKGELSSEMEHYRREQFFFDRQWRSLRSYANTRGIRLWGDLPIYVAGDSVDTWAHREQFDLDAQGNPVEVAGCPPDAFSATGQLWGNPLYRWDRMKEDGYAWWRQRMARTLELVDGVRIDHFRGFEQYYAIPSGEETAQFGQWRPGPGSALFHTLEQTFGPLPVVAEDLGFITPEVHQMRMELGYPGMKILQFAFDAPESDYLPDRYPKDGNCVVYSGTHDNDTLLGWVESAPDWVLQRAMDYLHLTNREDLPQELIRCALRSRARWVVVPMQDYLRLGTRARMNTPATVENNWRWRMEPGVLTENLAQEMRLLAQDRTNFSMEGGAKHD